MDRQTVRDGLEAAHDLIFENFKLLGEPDETVDLVEDGIAELDPTTEGFECPRPNCESTTIEQVLTDATIETPFRGFDRGRGEYDRSQSRITDGHIERYQCRDCGYVPEIDGQTVASEDMLREYLQNQDSIEA